MLDERKSSPSTFDLGFSVPSGELFIAVPTELNYLTQRVLRRERKVGLCFKSYAGSSRHRSKRGAQRLGFG